MFSIQQIISLFLMLSMELGIAGCGANAKLQQSAGTSVPPANIQDTQEPSSDTSPEPEGEVTEGTEFYQGFRMDNVLHAPEGDIHYHIYIPDSYDGSESYALYLTLPGYEGLYFQGAGQNLYSENFAFAALQYNDKMIVAAPQLNDWGKTSAEQTIALTEYLLAHYNIDPDRFIAEATGGDLFAITPAEPYTDEDLNWSDENSRVVHEYENPDERDTELVAYTPENWEDYDVVFVGYPIWWYDAAWPVEGFVEGNDFTGKTVIPFCTSSSSDIGESGRRLAGLAGTGDWQEGQRFRSGASESDIRAWVDSLNL